MAVDRIVGTPWSWDPRRETNWIVRRTVPGRPTALNALFVPIALGCGSVTGCGDPSGSPRDDLALTDAGDAVDPTDAATPDFSAYVADFPVEGLVPGELAVVLSDTLIDSYDAHTRMSTQALNNDAVRAGLKDILLNYANLWEKLRAAAGG